WAGRVDERCYVGERRAAGARRQIVLHRRQHHGELIIWHRYDSVGLAIHHRNRTSPVALTRDQPVAHSVGDGGATDSVLLGVLCDGIDRFSRCLAVEEAGIDGDAGFGERAIRRWSAAAGGCGYARNLEAILFSELEIALILAGRAHDCAGAVAHQDVVGDPNRDVSIGKDVVRVGAGEDAGFFLDRGHPLDFSLAARVGDISFDHRALRGGSYFGDERMLRCEHHERYAEDGVGARGEKADFFTGVSGDREGKFRAFAAPDPVALHQLDRFGPVDPIQIGEQSIRVVGDLDVPLLEVLLADRRVGMPPTASVDDLFVGEDRAALVAPPLRPGPAVGQAAFVEHQEEPLGPLVILGRRRVDLARPVVRASGDCQLALEVGGVTRDGFRGMRSFQNRLVFRGQSERIPSHRVQHVESRHPFEAPDYVARNVVVQMTDAQPGAGRVGEHLEDVEFWAAGVLARAVEIGAIPISLPRGLDFLWVVTFVHCSFCVMSPDMRLGYASLACRSRGSNYVAAHAWVQQLAGGCTLIWFARWGGRSFE